LLGVLVNASYDTINDHVFVYAALSETKWFGLWSLNS